MAKKYLDYDGLLYFWQKIKANFVTDVTYNSTTKKIQKTKAGSASDVVTLSTVATSGSYNDLSNKPSIPTIPNNFGTVKVGSTNVAADTTSDTLELVAGTNVTLTPDATNDKVTIAATDTTYEVASTTANGLMSSADKVKLNGIATGAEVNQNAFSNVKVGTTTIAADTKTDTLELVAGTSISITPDATNDKVTIGFNGTIPSAGTGSDYPKMDGTKSLGSNAGYARVDHVHPTDTTRAPLASPAFTGTPTAPTAATGTSTTQLATTEFVANTVGAMTSGVSDVQVDGASVVADGVAEISTFTGASTVAGTKGLVPAPSARSDSSARRALLDSAEWTRVGTSFTQPTSGPSTGKLLGTVLGSTGVVPTATTSANGAMSATDKTKLDGIEAGAQANVVTEMRSVNATAPQPLGQIQISYYNASDVTHTIKHLCVIDVTTTATTTRNGFMSATDKAKLNSLTITNGVIDASNLPSYVDDVIEAYPISGATALSAGWLSATSGGSALTPEAGKIYVLMADSGDYAANTQFRWGGSAYVKLADGGVSSITNAEIDTIVAA